MSFEYWCRTRRASALMPLSHRTGSRARFPVLCAPRATSENVFLGFRRLQLSGGSRSLDFVQSSVRWCGAIPACLFALAFRTVLPVLRIFQHTLFAQLCGHHS